MSEEARSLCTPRRTPLAVLLSLLPAIPIRFIPRRFFNMKNWNRKAHEICPMASTSKQLSQLSIGTSSHPILPTPTPSSNVSMPSTASKSPPAVGKADAPKDSGTVFASTQTVAATSNPAIACLSAASLPSGRVVTSSAATPSHPDLARVSRAHGSRSASPSRAYAQPPRTIVQLNRPASTTLLESHASISPTRASSSSVIALKSASSGSRASLKNLSATTSSLSTGGGLSGIATSTRGMPMSASVVSTFAIPLSPSEWLTLSPEEARVYFKAVVKAAATDGVVQVPAKMVGHAFGDTEVSGDAGSMATGKNRAWNRIKAVFRPHDDNDKQFVNSLKFPPSWIPRLYALFCLPPSATSGSSPFAFPPPAPRLLCKSSTSNSAWLADYLTTTPADDDLHISQILPSNLPLHATLWPYLLQATCLIRLLRYFSRKQLTSFWELTYLAKEETLLAMMMATVGDQRRKCVQHVLEVARVLVVERGVTPAVVASDLVKHVFDAGLDRVLVGRLSAWMVRVVCGRQAPGTGMGKAVVVASAAARRATEGSSMCVRTGTGGSSCASDGSGTAGGHTQVTSTPNSGTGSNKKHDTLPAHHLPHMTDPRFVSTSAPDVNDPPTSTQPVKQRASKVDLVERSCQMADLTQLGSDPVLWQSPADTLRDSGVCASDRYPNTINVANARLATHKHGNNGESVANCDHVQEGVDWKRRGTAPVITKAVSRRQSEAE